MPFEIKILVRSMSLRNIVLRALRRLVSHCKFMGTPVGDYPIPRLIARFKKMSWLSHRPLMGMIFNQYMVLLLISTLTELFLVGASRARSVILGRTAYFLPATFIPWRALLQPVKTILQRSMPLQHWTSPSRYTKSYAQYESSSMRSFLQSVSLVGTCRLLTSPMNWSPTMAPI